ncbi:MAG TPA: hypothetical protein VE422_03800 [Terriglobia bacterium]|nr:hypothetical protein [Terriglobia bacterium]
MRKLTQITTFVAVLVLFAVPLLSDTLVLKSGERVSGYFEGGSARVVKFRANDGIVKDYDILSVQQLMFGDEKSPISSSSRSATSSSSQTTPRLVPGNERVTHPASSSNAANTAWTIPTGSKLTIRMIDSINSESNQVGQTFVAVLDEPLYQGGVEVVPRGADVRGRIANINEAGRIAGKAELGLELTQIIVNGVPYSLTTSEYQEAAESRGGQTAKRAGIGAGIGAAIGAIAGGGKGAAIGAGVGAGGATAVQVLTKGEKLNIPSETKLDFTLRAPLVIAAR